MIIRICLVCNLPRKKTKNKVKTVCQCDVNTVNLYSIRNSTAD